MRLSAVVLAVSQRSGDSVDRVFPWWLPLAVAGTLALSVAVLYLRPSPFGRPSRFRWTAGNTVLLGALALVLGGWIAERRLVPAGGGRPAVGLYDRFDPAESGVSGTTTGSRERREVFGFVKVVAGGLGIVAVICLILFGVEARQREIRVETHWGGLGGGAGGWRLSPALLYLFLAVALCSMLTVIATRAMSSVEPGAPGSASETAAGSSR